METHLLTSYATQYSAILDSAGAKPATARLPEIVTGRTALDGCCRPSMQCVDGSWCVSRRAVLKAHHVGPALRWREGERGGGQERSDMSCRFSAAEGGEGRGNVGARKRRYEGGHLCLSVFALTIGGRQIRRLCRPIRQSPTLVRLCRQRGTVSGDTLGSVRGCGPRPLRFGRTVFSIHGARLHLWPNQTSQQGSRLNLSHSFVQVFVYPALPVM